MSRWQGKSRGTVLGHRIFVFTLRVFGVRAAYALLRFVALYYFLFAWKPVRLQYRYFRRFHHYGPAKAIGAVYANLVQFGQTLIDKVVVMSKEVETPFQIIREGEDHIGAALERGQGVLLISAHVGNWEAAGQLLNKFNTTVNIVMMDAEHQRLKGYMESVMNERQLNIIPIGDDLSHLVAIKQAFARNEIVAMHGDRFVEGQRTHRTDFMGVPALFPLGPFILAAKFRVPTLFVFCMKESDLRYHFYAYPPEPAVQKPEELLRLFVSLLNQKMKAYPKQWYNYYDFWAAETPDENGDHSSR